VLPEHRGQGGSTATAPETVLFVCRHGAAKSVLAAEDFRALAVERGLKIEAVAAGLDPDAQIASVLIEAVTSGDLSKHTPRAVTSADVAVASRVITFDLMPDELVVGRTPVERWDDIPSVSQDVHAARDAIRRHLDPLIEGYASRTPPEGGEIQDGN